MKPLRPNRFLSAALVTTGFALSLCFSHAATLTWDGNGSTAPNPNGGNGTWDVNTTANWWNGTSNVVWPALGGTNDDAVFANTLGTVTLGTAITANDLTFNTTGYILSGAQILTLNGATPTITTASGVTTTIGNNTATVIDGTVGLTKAGAGTLILNGSAVNTFTGGLNINGGTLALDFTNLATPADLINSGNALTLRGGTLSVIGKSTDTTSQTFAGLTLTSGVSTISLNSNGGTATNLVLGAITRNADAVVNFTLPASGAISTSTGNTNDILGTWASVGSGASTKYATVTGGNIAALTGTAVADGSGLTDTTGTVNYDLAAGGGTVPATVSANTIRYTGAVGTTAPGATAFTVNGLMNSGTGLWTIGANALTIGSDKELVVNAANNNITISGGIKNNGGGASRLIKTGSGNLTLSGNNTFTGGVTIAGGTLTLNNAGALNSTTPNAITLGVSGSNSPTLDLNGLTPTIASLTVGPNVSNAAINTNSWAASLGGVTTLNSPLRIVRYGNNTHTGILTAGKVTGNGGGSGATTLTFEYAGSNNFYWQADNAVNNDFVGNIRVTGGQVRLQVGTSGVAHLPTASMLIIDSGATFSFSTNVTAETIDGLNGFGALNHINGSAALTLNSSNASNDGYRLFAGAIGSGITSVTKTGTGTQTFTGLSTYNAPTSIQNGILSINTIKSVNGGSSALGAVTTVANGTIAMGSGATTGTLQYTGTGNTTDRVINLAGTTGGATLDQSGASGLLEFTSAFTATGVGAKTLTLQGSTAGTGQISGAIVNGSGTTSVAKSGTGTWTLSGVNTYTGSTTINNGTLQIGGAGDQTLSGIITGSGGTLAKTGAGTLTLSNVASDYTGATTVNAGKLNVTGNLTSSATTVNNGGVLMGTGALGSVTVANGTGAITAGNGTSGTLTLGSLTFNGTGTINIGTLTNGALANYTSTAAVNVTGALTLSGGTGGVTLNLSPGALAMGTYTLLGFGSTTATLDKFALGTGPALGARQIGALDLTGNNLTYVVSGDAPKWTGAQSGAWTTNTVGGLSNWKLITGGGATDYITNDTVLFDDSATGTTTVDITTANVTPASIVFNNSTKNYTITSSSFGITAGTLTVQGGGTVTINTANSYAGGTTISNGTLVTGTNTALGSGTLALNSGTLNVNGQTLGNAITLGGGAIVGSGTLSNQISGAAGLTYNSLGNTLVLNGANTYLGGTTISNGTLVAGTNTALSTGTVALNGGTLDINGKTLGNAITLGGGAITGAGTLSGVISGAGALTKSGAGTLILTNTNSYGGTTISVGTLQVGNGGTTGSLGSGAVLNNSSLVYNQTSTTIANAISGSGTVSNTGATGALTINQSISLTNNNFTFNSVGGSLATGANLSVGTGTGSLTSSVGGNFGFSINGTNSLSAVGAGSITITGNASTGGGGYSGLNLGGSNLTTAGTVNLKGQNSGEWGVNLTGATIHATGGITTVTGTTTGAGSGKSPFFFGGGTVNLNADSGAAIVLAVGAATGSGNYLFTDNSSNTTFNATGNISFLSTDGGAGGVFWRGNSTFTTAANSALLFDAGNVSMNSGNGNMSVSSMGANSSVTIAGTATGSTLAGTKALTTATSSLAYNITGSGSLNDSSVISGSGSVVKNGAGTVTLSGGTNSYSGGTTINAGTLTAGHVNAFGTGNINVTGGELALASFNVTNAITLNGGKLTGTNLSLNNVTVGANTAVAGTFTGTFNTGTSSSRTINTTGGASFQNLTGQGSFTGGLVTVTGAHTPGNSPGTQTFDSGLTFANNSTLTLEIAADGSAADFIGVTGAGLNIGTDVTLILDLDGTAVYSTAFWDANHDFTLISTNIVAGNFKNPVVDLLESDLAQGSWSYGWTGNDYKATWTAVPEPNVAALLGGLGTLALLRRRRN